MEYKDRETYTFTHEGCRARVRLTNFKPAVKERFSKALGRELFKAYEEKEGLHDRGELGIRAMA